MLFYDIHPKNDEPMFMTCLRWLVEGIVLIGFIFSILVAVIITAAWMGVL
jgi:hypothetical protein